MSQTSPPNPLLPVGSVLALRAEIRDVAAEIFALLYTGRYFIREGSDNAGCLIYCDGTGVVFVERVEGRLCLPVSSPTEAATMDWVLSWVSEPATRVASPRPFSECRDENVARTLTNLRHVRSRLERWSLWKFLDGQLHGAWPRRLQAPRQGP